MALGCQGKVVQRHAGTTKRAEWWRRTHADVSSWARRAFSGAQDDDSSQRARAFVRFALMLNPNGNASWRGDAEDLSRGLCATGCFGSEAVLEHSARIPDSQIPRAPQRRFRGCARRAFGASSSETVRSRCEQAVEPYRSPAGSAGISGFRFGMGSVGQGGSVGDWKTRYRFFGFPAPNRALRRAENPRVAGSIDSDRHAPILALRAAALS